MQLQQCKHRDARNPERTRRLEKQQTMHCLVKLICCWNEEEWQQGKVSGSCLFTRAVWEDSQYPSSACEMVPQATNRDILGPAHPARALLATAAPQQHCRGHRLATGCFKGASHFTCCKAFEILSGVTATFSHVANKTSSNGNVPSQLES